MVAVVVLRSMVAGFYVSAPNLSLNPDAPRRACGPSFVAPVSLVR